MNQFPSHCFSRRSVQLLFSGRRQMSCGRRDQLLLAMDDAVSDGTEASAATDPAAMQHDLEKLQEAHDKLLQELEEKRTFSDNLHSQLDSMIERNDSLSQQLQEKEQDLEKAVQMLKENEPLAAKVQETEAKNTKLKQLAVKLKKELAEAKEEVSKTIVLVSPYRNHVRPMAVGS